MKNNYNRKLFALFILIIFLTGFVFSYEPSFQLNGAIFGKWSKDLEEAKDLAIQNNTFVVIFVGSSGCGACDTAMNKVYNTKYFYDWSKDNKVPLVYANYKNTSRDGTYNYVKKTYLNGSVPKFPVIVFINPQNNTKIKSVYLSNKTFNYFLGLVNSLEWDFPDEGVFGGFDGDIPLEEVCVLAPEVCNGFDDDCDEQIDEGLEFSNYYIDFDGDGFGAGDPISSCSPNSGDYVVNGNDCDDSKSSVYPGAYEICDELDNDCGGEVDETFNCVKGSVNFMANYSYEIRRVNDCNGNVPSNAVPNYPDGKYAEKWNGSKWITLSNDTYFYKESNTDCTYSCIENYFYKDGNCHPYSCIKIDINYLTATICPNDNQDIIEDYIEDYLVSDCTQERKCEYTCNEGYNLSINPSNRTRFCSPHIYSCIGEFENANLFKGDGSNLTQDTISVLSDINTSNKCEYHCTKNFVLNDENKCILNPFQCIQTELIDSNAVVYADDNVDLVEDTNSVLVDSNTSAKCEYHCKKGYHKGFGVDENKCVLNNYFCEGEIDLNAIPCVDWNKDLDQNTTNTLGVRCNTSKKCVWICQSGFERGLGEDINKCVPKGVYSCTGLIDTNSAEIILGDDENLTLFDNLINTIVFEDTPMKCEWKCKEGYQLIDINGIGYNCVEKSKEKFKCIGIIDSNAIIYDNDDSGLTQDTNSLLSITNTQRKCEYHCRQGYYLSIYEGESICLPLKYNCIGTIPNGVIYIGDDYGLSQDTNVLLTESNTSKKCEYHCAVSYKKEGNVCVPLNLSTAVCGNAERGFVPDESFPSSFTLCEKGIPSNKSPSLSQEIGSITSWVCVDDVNVECFASRVSSKYVEVPEEEKITNSIIKATAKMDDGGKIKLTLKCEKTAVVQITVKDYLSKEEYKINQKNVDCPVSEDDFVIELESIPSEEKTFDIKVALIDEKDCGNCELTYYMNYIPSEEKKEDNLLGFIIIGVMVLILIIGVGVYLIIKKNKQFDN